MTAVTTLAPWEGIDLGEPVQAYVVEDGNETNGIPANLEAERAVLGSILIDPDGIRKVADVLAVGDFFRERHQVLYEAMLALYRKREPIDIRLLQEQLGDEDLAFIGGPAYLTDLIASTPTALYIDHYAKIVREKAMVRWLRLACQKIMDLTYERREAGNMLELAHRIVTSLIVNAGSDQDMEQLGSILSRVMDNLEERSKQTDRLQGLPTGFDMLDRILAGLGKGKLYIVAARPGMGKSSLATSIIANVIKSHDARVGVFSVEMTKEQIGERILSAEAGVDGHQMKTGNLYEDDFTALTYATNVLFDKQCYVDDSPSLTILQLKSKARRLYAEKGLDLIVVDYMQIVKAEGERQKHDEIATISRELTELAKELNVPIVALAQLSRAVEQRADKRPIMSDLGGSSQIEKDAWAILFIYCEDHYIEDTDRQNIADIIIAKHRDGATGTVSLFFRRELSQFRDLELTRTDLDY